MNEQGRLRKFMKAFGFIYFAVNCVLFAVVCILIVFTAMKSSDLSGGLGFLLLPFLGIISGYWMRHHKFNWWRNIIIGVSLLVSCLAVFFVIFILPQVEKINNIHKEKAQELKQLDAEVEKYFNAVYANDIAAVEKFLDQGVYVDAKDKAGATALHVTQDKPILELLISRGAEVNALDDMGMTPMFNKEVGLSKMLVEAGADIELKSRKGNTPLLWYAYSGYVDGVKYLISLGADVNHKNADGQTALDIAEKFHHRELTEHLNSAGAMSGKGL